MSAGKFRLHTCTSSMPRTSRYTSTGPRDVSRTPRRQSDIEASGLRDPGFGPGPVYYADLDLVEVRLSDWVAHKGEAGRADFAYLLETLAGSPDLDLGDETVLWKKR